MAMVNYLSITAIVVSIVVVVFHTNRSVAVRSLLFHYNGHVQCEHE